MKTVRRELNDLFKDKDMKIYIDGILNIINKRFDKDIKKCYKAKYITQEYSGDHNDCDLCMAHGLEKLKKEINKI